MIQFYATDIEKDSFLPEEESSHCCRVLRMKEGDMIRVTNGQGSIYNCRILKADPRHTKLEIIEKESLPSPSPRLTIAVAPTKNIDRIEWFLEKAEEIGVSKIVLLKCTRSERKNLRIDRLRRILISAMNQSLSAFLPQLQDFTDFKEFVKSEDSETGKFFGYCSADFPKKEFVKEYKPGENVTVMIGPEGDFTQEEVSLAIDRGFFPVTFGEKRLRTETAALYAVCSVQVINRLHQP